MTARSMSHRRIARHVINVGLGLLLFVVVHTPFAMEPVRISPDGKGFVLGNSGKPFRIWGVNYDRDESVGGSRLLEDYWVKEWDIVRQDFKEIRDLGANVVRIHLQLGKFMTARDQTDEAALSQLRKLLDLAEENGLRLDLTGLGCYRKQGCAALV